MSRGQSDECGLRERFKGGACERTLFVATVPR